MKKIQLKKIIVVLILFILFVSPFFVAQWFFYHRAPEVLSTLGTVNQGKLITPPIKLTINPDKKWYLLCVFSDKIKNDHEIILVLDKIQRIRLSLGKEFTQTGALFILSYSKEVKMPTILSEIIPQIILPENKITELLAFTDNKQGIFMMDPENNVLLAYPVNINSEAIYKDIRRLLKYSKTPQKA